MSDVNINNTMEIRLVGMKVLTDAVGNVGAVRFLQLPACAYGAGPVSGFVTS